MHLPSNMFFLLAKIKSLCHFLTPEQRQHKIGVCKDVHQQAQDDPNFIPRMTVVSVASTQRPHTVTFTLKEPAVFTIKEGLTGKEHNKDYVGGFLRHLGEHLMQITRAVA